MEQIQTLPAQKLTRRYDLDWLRVIAFSLLIFYHTGMFFVEWEWHIKNNEISKLMEWPMLFLAQWRMPLLFFISGAGVFFALGKRSTGKFINERLKRILLPLIAGMLIIVPPQVYIERLTQGATFSYLEFYPSIFYGIPYPEGNFSWHHLWYLAYIFTFSLICLPLFGYLRSDRGQQLLARLADFLPHTGRIYLLILPLFVSDVLLRPYWPTQQNLLADWANFTFSILLFIYGFIICSNENIRQSIEEQRRFSLAAALFTAFLMFAFYWADWVNADPLGTAFYWFLKDSNIWLWLMAILGYARKHLNFSTKALQYANEAVYPFYILHQTVIVCMAYYMINWQASIAVKYTLISMGMFLVCLFLYEFLIKRTNLTRILFGLKPLPKPEIKPLTISVTPNIVL